MSAGMAKGCFWTSDLIPTMSLDHVTRTRMLTADRAESRADEARSVGALAAHTVLECVREREV